MTYTPTSWASLSDELRKLFTEITCLSSSNVSEILREAIVQSTATNPPSKSAFYEYCTNNLGISKDDRPLIESCRDFVDYQLNNPKMCNGIAATFSTEGFQIGSPWHGDILQAPVLFLSVNPAVTQNCYFPRWHVGTDTFTFAGLGTPATNDQQIYEFFRDRLTNAHINKNGTPYAMKTNGTHFPVSYWRGIFKTMNELSGINQDSRTTAEHCRRLMRSVLSAEVIFWGSKDSEHATDTQRLRYFWEKFTVPMLEKCAAKISSSQEVQHKAFFMTSFFRTAEYTPLSTITTDSIKSS